MKKIKQTKGITLIALIVTIIILLILSVVTFKIITDDNGIINKSETAKEESEKAAATETMNLKITNVQISKYAEEQRMPTLKELADNFCEDDDFQYVQETSEVASLTKISNNNPTSIYTKLKAYPYEFEIDSTLKLASIDGIKIANNTSNGTDEWNNMNTWEKLLDIGFTLEEIANNEIVLSKALNNENDIQYMLQNTETVMPTIVNSKIAMKYIVNTESIKKRIFGDTDENISVNSTWISAILNSENAIAALDETSPITVPNMTGATTPSGEAKASAETSDHPAHYAFNTNTGMFYYDWLAYGGTNNWIQYRFTSPILVYKFFMQNQNANDGMTCSPAEFSLLGSNDGENWDNLGDYTNNNYSSSASKTYITKNISKKYLYYRIFIKTAKMANGTDSSYTRLLRLQFYGK